MTNWQAWIVCGLLTSLPAATQADIFRWDNGQLIPGTEDITPGPRLNLSSFFDEWSSPERNLRFADFTGGLDLTQANFSFSWLDNAQFNGANLTDAFLGAASLTNADLSGTNLTNAWLGRGGGPFGGSESAILTNANLSGATVSGTRFPDATSSGFTKEQLYFTASYQQRNLRGIGLGDNDLTGWDFSGQDLTEADLANATLTHANLAGAVVAGANFGRAGGYYEGPRGSGLTLPQLYSTASYQQRNLRGIGLSAHNLTSGDFSRQDLTGADFWYSTLTNANFTRAMVMGASFYGTSFTSQQLYSTASYQQRNLRGIGLSTKDLNGWDFSGQDLTGADLALSTLTNANFTGAIVTGANFGDYFGNSSSFTKEQLYSTASYQQRNLQGIGLSSKDLNGWDFSGQDLTGADLALSHLWNANFAGAIVTEAVFGNYLGYSFGFTKEQLYSTASYQQRNLRGINLWDNDLTGWDFSGQDLAGAYFVESLLTNANLSGTNLTNAYFFGATLTNANLSGANLTNARLGDSYWHATLTNANLAGAVVAGANFQATTSQGFTREQLYSTASYQQRNLQRIGLSGNDLTGWDFSGQDLTGALFYSSTLRNANFSFADLRGAQLNTSEPIQLARNTIRESGAISGLDLAAGETLVVRDSAIGVTVNYNMNAVSGSTLEIVLSDADWDSTMAVAAGITPDLGGTLRVRFADQVNLATLLGTTYDFFDWPAVLDTNNRFDGIELPPGTQWDLSQLYVTGTAQLTAIPEPSAVLLFACGTAACAVARRRILANRRGQFP